VSAQVLDDQGMLGPASPIPTPCLLLKNSECLRAWVHVRGCRAGLGCRAALLPGDSRAYVGGGAA